MINLQNSSLLFAKKMYNFGQQMTTMIEQWKQHFIIMRFRRNLLFFIKASLKKNSVPCPYISSNSRIYMTFFSDTYICAVPMILHKLKSHFQVDKNSDCLNWGFVHFSRGTNSTNSNNSINSTTPMESSLVNQTLLLQWPSMNRVISQTGLQLH